MSSRINSNLVRVTNTADKPLHGVVIDKSPFGNYDEIAATYPTTVTELYTYKLASVDVGTVLVTYTDGSKKVLTSVVYNAI